MQFIELDAAGWSNLDVVYSALFNAIGAPEWHGRNLNALYDSMIIGGINELEAPYRLRFTGLANCAPIVRQHLLEIAEAVSDTSPVVMSDFLEIDVKDQINPAPDR